MVKGLIWTLKNFPRHTFFNQKSVLCFRNRKDPHNFAGPRFEAFRSADPDHFDSDPGLLSLSFRWRFDSYCIKFERWAISYWCITGVGAGISLREKNQGPTYFCGPYGFIELTLWPYKYDLRKWMKIATFCYNSHWVILPHFPIFFIKPS
jgi:hypothetical protein